MEYPIGAANTALMNQLKQNEILSTQNAADKALAELEAEIKNAKIIGKATNYTNRIVFKPTKFVVPLYAPYGLPNASKKEVVEIR